MNSVIDVQKILEYNDFFEGGSPDVDAILKKYSREMLLNIIGVLGNAYQLPHLIDSHLTFFSEYSKSHITDLNERWEKFRQVNPQLNPVYCTNRTILELTRRVFAISVNEYADCGAKEDCEYDIFKAILALNQQLMDLKSWNLDENALVFILNYVSNDVINTDIRLVFRQQKSFYDQLVKYLDHDEESRALREAFLSQVGIESLDAYFATWLALFYYTDFDNPNRRGRIVISPEFIKKNEHLISQKVIDYLALDATMIYPYSEGVDDRENNTDYRIFRSHPLIKLSDGTYLIYCLPLLLERLFNSLYFDLKGVSKGIISDFNQWYNKGFVEHWLFQQTMLYSLSHRVDFSFPLSQTILSAEKRKELPHEPDFYIREGESLILFECKSIKINGILKDKADAAHLVETLKLKLDYANRQVDPTRKSRKSEEVGVSQLIRQITMIEDDIFTWDENIPNDVTYYPVMVLDDWKLSQGGMMVMMNEWYQSRLKKEGFSDQAFNPLIVVSLGTILMYADVFKRNGYHRIFEQFLSSNAGWDEKQSTWDVLKCADFDRWIRINYRLSANMKESLGKLSFLERAKNNT